MIESGLLHIGSFFIGLEFIALIAFTLIASLYDIKFRRIPNKLILVGIFVSLFHQVFSGYGYGFAFWIVGFSTGFLLFLPLYILRVMGAGDVKMMAVVGSFLGGAAAVQTVLLTLLSGGIFALLIIASNKRWKLVFENVRFITTSMSMATMTRQLPKAQVPMKSAGNLPYGVAIAAGTLLYIAFLRP